jgi:hypothetical protein
MNESRAQKKESEEQQLEMLKRRVRKAQERVRPYLKPGQSLAGELIADRRREAEQESDAKSSSGRAPVVFHRLNLTASLLAVDQFAALGLEIAFFNVG